MPRFLDTDASNAQIIRTIKNAGKELLLISPYVQLSSKVAQWLRTVNDRGVQIELVCRCASLAAKERDALLSYDGLNLRDAPDLHAKCYANESGIVLTSLNLYRASRENYEMGVLFSADDDKALYQEALAEAHHIVTHAKLVEKSKPSPKRSWISRAKKNGGSRKSRPAKPSGYCIRCEAEIDRDPQKPYCAGCFRQWLRFKNPAYADNHCHGCGKKDDGGFSLEKPECYPCYKKHAKRQAA